MFDRAAELEREGREIWHLEIGRPDWRLPPGAMQGLHRALDDGEMHYIANRGLLELREAIADEVAATGGGRYDPETQLIVTVGASEALAMSTLALLGPGDEAIVPQPAWNHYVAAVEMAGATPVPLPLDPGDGFRLDPDRLEAALGPHTRMLVVNTPSNPTGSVQAEADLKAIAALAIERGVFVFADEIYRDFVHEGNCASIASLMGDSPLLLHAGSFSKSYAMTGWRIGWLGAAEPISDACNRVHQYLTVCGVPFAQRAAAAVLRHPGRGEYLAQMRSAFADRRRVWLEALDGCPGVELVAPTGAFYLFPRIDHDGLSGAELCEWLLEERGLAMVPGAVFGEDYHAHVRISYGGPLETQRAAAAVLREALEQ